MDERTYSDRVAALWVEDLTKHYEDHLALDSLSFEVSAGQILGMVGPNGAGKTTALRSVVGVLPIQQGRVEICGYDITRQERQAKRCLGWVPDDPQPFDTLTVNEHLEFTAALYRVADWRTRAEELLEQFELSDKRDALGGELSRGMRQKLAFACAWLPEPRIVLLDEPLSGLDPRGIRAAKQAIRDLAARGTAVILSSHLLELIEELAERLFILDRGRCVFFGSLDEARHGLAAGAPSSLEDIFFAATESNEHGGVDDDGPAAEPATSATDPLTAPPHVDDVFVDEGSAPATDDREERPDHPDQKELFGG